MPNVLLVDDDPSMRQIWRIGLRLTGFSISEAEDGQDALEKIEQSRPDVVIMDVMMPGMDGISALKALRAAASTADLPVIIVTAKSSREAVRDCLAAGANRYLTKPVSRQALLDNIQEVLREAGHSSNGNDDGD